MLCRACDCEVVRESVLLQDESRQYVRGAMQVTIRRDQRKHSKTKNKLNQQKRYLLCAKRMELVQFQQMNLFSRFFSPILCCFHWLAPFYVFLVALICLLFIFSGLFFSLRPTQYFVVCHCFLSFHLLLFTLPRVEVNLPNLEFVCVLSVFG